jgi:effector-binding domain-containing protein
MRIRGDAMKAAKFLFQLGCVAALMAGQPLYAQTVPAPQPVESRPLPPPPAAAETPKADPSPAAPQAAPASPTTPQAAVAPPNAAVQTLVPAPADPSMPDKVELAAKPAALLRGAATWDDGYDKLTGAFAKLQDSMAANGIPVTGKPIALFLETDDLGFRFETQLPIERAPAERPAGLAADIRFGMTPAGTAWRFVHRAPYEDIDSTYEAITAYLDQRGIDAKETFIEEYVTLGQDPSDEALEINIFVQPRK